MEISTKERIKKMKNPFTNKQMIVRKERRILRFRNEEFEILSHTYQCVDSGYQFEDDVFAQLNYDQVINQYKAKHPKAKI